MSTEYRVGFRDWLIWRYVDVDISSPFHVEPPEVPVLAGRNRVHWSLGPGGGGHTKAKCQPTMTSVINQLVTQGGTWEPHNCEFAPQKSCSCGLYASHLPQRENSFGVMTGLTGRAYGAVLGWGRRFRHGEEGFRAEFMKPIAFWIPPQKTFARPASSHVELILEIAKLCDARIFSRMDEMARYAFTLGKTWHPLGQQAVDEYFSQRRWSRGVHDAVR